MIHLVVIGAGIMGACSALEGQTHDWQLTILNPPASLPRHLGTW